MTPPVSPSSRAASRGTPAATARQRSAGDLAAASAAAAALAALVAGVPVLLVTVVGLPIPHAVPSLSMLTHPLDIVAVLRVLSVVGWLAWLQLVVCVIAEVRAAVRNSGMPARIPLAGGTQTLVHRLVTTALLLASATSALSPALVHPAPARPPHTVSASALAGALPPAAGQTGASGAAGQRGSAVTGDAAPGGARPGGRQGGAAPGGDLPGGRQDAPVPVARADSAPRTEKIYVVKPPAGRYHESLWEIAHNHLGNGRRYREIFELNVDRVQSDGSKLTMASLIRPGWVLRMPHDAYGPGIEVVARGGQHPGSHPDTGAASDKGAAGPQAGAGTGAAAGAGAAGLRAGEGGSLAGGTRTGTGPVGTGPGPAGTEPGPAGRTAGPASAGPEAATEGVPGARQAIPATRPDPGPPVYPSELAAASLLAAGVLSALGRRRRVQLWARASGRRVATPEGEAALAEAALRLGASEPSCRLLDAGLRQLSGALARQDRTPPTVFAAHLSEAELDLWVAPADHDVPPPWVAVGDGRVWRLPSGAVRRIGPGGDATAPAPYPGLVSIGTDHTGRVLVDLEAAHGLIAVTGPGHVVPAALAAMAAELATNRWSDQMHITLVGFGRDLTVLAPARMTVVPTLAEALPALEARTLEVERALAAAGVDSVLTGRSAGLTPEAWVPHYLISAVTPSPAERERLIALARTRHATVTGYVVAGEVAGATWTWELTGEGRLRAGLLGLDVQAQLLPPQQQRSVADLFRAAAEPGGAELAPPALDQVPEEHLDPEAVMPVEVTMLGRVAVRAPGFIEPDRLAAATEMVVYCAAHPGGVHRSVLAAAIWPRGVTTDVRDTMLAGVREWLGRDGIGRPHLATDASGRLRLGSGVRVDWNVFLATVARAGLGAGRGGHSAAARGEESYLSHALSLVEGRFLDGRERGRYAWLAAGGLESEVEARVADAAHRLWELRMEAGDPLAAIHAARAGLRLAAADELLWRDLLRAAHATGRPGLLRSVVAEVCARTPADAALPRMAPETEALIDELLPSWRTSVA